jgi:ligand-binding sensor domain-containing protein/signal transduction histidine kinase
LNGTIRKTGSRILTSLLLPALLSLGGTADARALDPGRMLSQYVYEIWTTDDGLPMGVVNGVLQTRDGYLWVATEQGVARFDGVRFEVFSAGTISGLPNNRITSLYEDSRGALWLTTHGGLATYRDGAFTFYTEDDGLPHPIVQAVHEDADGSLWIGSKGPLARLIDGRFVLYQDDDGGTIDDVAAIRRAADGSIWLCRTNDTLELRDGRLFRHVLAANRANPRRPDVCRVEPDGSLLVGGRGVLSTLQAGRESALPFGPGLGDGTVTWLARDRSGTLWLGFIAGLARYRDGRFEVFGAQGGSAANQIETLYEDREGALWIGTNGGGLARLRDGKFATFSTAEGLAGEYVYTIMQDRAGDIWIGTSGGGLDRLRDDGIRHYGRAEGLASDHALSVEEDREGAIWIGTADGLFRFADGGFQQFTTKDGLPGTVVFHVKEDREGRIWLATNAGVGLYRDRTFVNVDHPVKTGVVATILEDRHGDLWFGTGAGVLRWQEGELRTFEASEALSGSPIIALHEDRHGTIWIGTYGSGLFRLRDGDVTRYTEQDGFPSAMVYQILEDDGERLWMCDNEGVFHLGIEELNRLADGRLEALAPVRYGKGDGMRSVECNGGQQPAAWRSRDGAMWFATTNGAAVVEPGNMPVNDLPPPVRIEQGSVDGRPAWKRAIAPAGNESTFAPGRGDLEFHYTGLSFLEPGKVRFRYQLEGYDDDWIDAGTRRVAYYTNIPSGRYTFRVTASNNDGVWNEAGATLRFRLRPHFHETAWFYGLCLIGLVAVGHGFYRLRVHNLRQRHAVLESLVAERTHDLATAKEALEDSNRTLERRVQDGIEALREAERMAAYGELVAGVAHEVRQPIFALQAASYVLADRLKNAQGCAEQLATVDRETGRMSRLMEDLLAFSRPPTLWLAETDPKSVLEEAVAIFRGGHPGATPRIIVDAASGPPAARLDRARIVQVIVNLMGNALRHADGTRQITLRAEQVQLPSGAGLRLRVEDDGAGIADDVRQRIFEPFFTTGSGTGLGLAIVRRVVEQHDGRIWLDGEVKCGAAFNIDLPIAGTAGDRLTWPHHAGS